MAITARIILDSTNGLDRLTTFVLTYPRFIHSELMTHRDFSRNAASSRAIPMSKVRQRLIDEPGIPIHWSKNQKGMQAWEEVEDKTSAREWWFKGLASAMAIHREGEALGLHKQVVNRVIEPYMTMETLVSATNFWNFFALRDHKDADPNFQKLAHEMYLEYKRSTPQKLTLGDWHTPFVTEEDSLALWGLANKELNQGRQIPVTFPDGYIQNKVKQLAKKVSVGRCCRISYLNHEGKRDIQEDIDLHDKLAKVGKDLEPGHWSPFEHVAMADFYGQRSGNFIGFQQYRKQFPNEYHEKEFFKPIPIEEFRAVQST